MALLWAAGIIWLALDVAGPDSSNSGDAKAHSTGLTDATGEPLSDEDVRKFADALNAM